MVNKLKLKVDQHLQTESRHISYDIKERHIIIVIKNVVCIARIIHR